MSRDWTAFYKAKYDEWHIAIPNEGSSFNTALCPDGILPEQDASVREYYAHRIVDCVNALTGISDPAAYRAAFEAMTGKADKALDAFAEGVVWNDEQRAAYKELADSLASARAAMGEADA